MRESDYIDSLPADKAKKYRNVLKLFERRNREAKEELQNIVEELPDFAPAYNKLAVIAIREDKTEKAEELLYEAVEIDSEFAPAITNLGSLARKAGNKERAKKLYEKAVEIDPEYGPAYNNLGVIYREAGDYANSIKYLKKARKHGSFVHRAKNDKPFYKEPGCLVGLLLLIGFGLLFYLWMF
ncbi:MAG: tetratricopeptide repeat protein [Bacillota bacterium]